MPPACSLGSPLGDCGLADPVCPGGQEARASPPLPELLTAKKAWRISIPSYHGNHASHHAWRQVAGGTKEPLGAPIHSSSFIL